MRLLIIGDARAEHLARWADHFSARGDQVLMATAEANAAADVCWNKPFGRDALAYPLLVPALRNLIHRFKPDLLAAHYLPNYGLMAVLSGFRPHVVFGWGSDLLLLPQRGTLQRARLKLVATRGQEFVVDAHMLVDPLVRLGAPPDRIHVCPFGVTDDMLHIADTARRPTAAFPVLMCNRRHESNYEIATFLRALRHLAERDVPFHAVIGHSGSETEHLKRLAHQLEIDSRIQWTGYLPRCPYRRSLAAADIYVSPCPSDSTSVSLLEAMAAGLAVVMPDIPGHREWIAPGSNGLLYRAGDVAELARCLETLCGDPDLCSELGRAGARTVSERGRWADHVRTVEDLFDRLAGISK